MCVRAKEPKDNVEKQQRREPPQVCDPRCRNRSRRAPTRDRGSSGRWLPDMTPIGSNGPAAQDDTVEVTIRIDRKLHEELKPFFADQLMFSGYQDLFDTLLQALCSKAGTDPCRRSFLDLLEFTHQQRDISFEENLFGRPGNEHHRRQLYGMMLGMERLQMVNNYEWDEMEEKRANRFARDTAKRFARDLNRNDATQLIEGMTLGSASLHAEMLHWLDVELAEQGKT